MNAGCQDRTVTSKNRKSTWTKSYGKIDQRTKVLLFESSDTWGNLHWKEWNVHETVNSSVHPAWIAYGGEPSVRHGCYEGADGLWRRTAEVDGDGELAVRPPWRCMRDIQSMGAAWSVVEWLVGYVLFMLAYFLSIFSLIFPRINIFLSFWVIKSMEAT